MFEAQQVLVDAINEVDVDVAAVIGETERLNASDRVAIYRESIEANLCKALNEIYPVCEKLVGQQFFNAMALCYVKQTPSDSADLALYGTNFNEFIADFPPAQSLPYLADVAKLEHALHISFLGPNNEKMCTSELQQVPQQHQLQFYLPCASALISSDFPVKQIWVANQLPKDEQSTIDLDQGGERLLVWRQNSNFHVDELSLLEWNLLSLIQNGCTLAELVEIGEDIVELLPRLISNGWVNRYNAKENR